MEVQHDVPLAERTTLGVGGTARRFVRVTTIAELRAAIANEPRLFILGGGSNVVIGDAGWDGTVVQMAIDHIARDGDLVTAGAGVAWDEFVAAMVAEGRAGVECLAGIPGLVGATPMQNVGAYGQEVADTIAWVSALDRERDEVVRIAPDECGFGYRTSRFKHAARWVIVDVAFTLPRAPTSAPIRYAELAAALGVAIGERAPLAATRETVIALRRTKGMVVDPADPDSRSAGSFFTNPIVNANVATELAERFPGMPAWPTSAGASKLAAAWLIERAGFHKGYAAGRAGISTKHALALINRGGASAAEILDLARTIQREVERQFGITLVPEPVIVA